MSSILFLPKLTKWLPMACFCWTADLPCKPDSVGTQCLFSERCHSWVPQPLLFPRSWQWSVHASAHWYQGHWSTYLPPTAHFVLRTQQPGIRPFHSDHHLAQCFTWCWPMKAGRKPSSSCVPGIHDTLPPSPVFYCFTTSPLLGSKLKLKEERCP